MGTLVVAILSFLGFIVAYHTYGRWLARRIFGLDAEALVPSQQLRDDVDYVPTQKSVIFGHHFTSIAGTGPIVGPAIAVFWGWLPALLWVVLGSIFIGAVHDFGALVVSLRNRGQTVGEVAGRLITPRARILFLLVLFFSLTIVLAIFGLVIASIFKMYPASVLSVWIAMPVAVAIGFWVHRGKGNCAGPLALGVGRPLRRRLARCQRSGNRLATPVPDRESGGGLDSHPHGLLLFGVRAARLGSLAAS